LGKTTLFFFFLGFVFLPKKKKKKKKTPALTPCARNPINILLRDMMLLLIFIYSFLWYNPRTMGPLNDCNAV
jgi:hypothetical protein